MGELKQMINGAYTLLCLSFLPVQEEGVEATQHCRAGHGPYEHLHRERHDCRHLVWEGSGKHCGEQPHRHLEVFTARRLWGCPLVPPQAVEKQDKVQVGESHEGDGSKVSIWAVNHHARVESQEQEAGSSKQWDTMVFAFVRH